MDNFKEAVAEVKRRIDIVSLVESVVRLRRAGRNYTGLCPFHQEKTPSFIVSPQGQNYHCYGCQAHGDVFSFICATQGIDFYPALLKLAAQAGVEISGSETAETNKFIAHYQCLASVTKFYAEQLASSKTAQLYLKERGISPELITKFELGFAAKSRPLREHLLADNQSIEAALELGLIRKSDEARYLDFFYEKLIIPIKNSRQQTIGFAGRRLDGGMPKYINSVDSMLYKKSRTLYGVDQAAESWRELRRAIVVEGYFDVIALHQNGFPEAVASCGTAFTQGQAEYINSKNIAKLYLLFDNDKAGQSACLKSLQQTLDFRYETFIIELKDSKDPDDYFKSHSTKEFQLLIEQAKPAEEFLLNHYSQIFEHSLIGAQSEILSEVTKYYSDEVKKDLWFSKLAKALNIEKNSLKYSPQPQLRIVHQNEAKPDLLSLVQLERIDAKYRAEFDVARALFIFPQYYSIIQDLDIAKHITCEVLKPIVIEYLDMRMHSSGEEMPEIIDLLPANRQVAAFLIQSGFKLEMDHYDAQSLMQRTYTFLQNSYFLQKRQRLNLAQTQAEQTLAVEEYSAQMEKIEHLRQRK